MVFPRSSDFILPMGRILATPGALRALAASSEQAATFLRRHECGDWGGLNSEDWELNERSLKDGSRILSAYKLESGERIWIVTEADRSSTTILLPDEY